MGLCQYPKEVEGFWFCLILCTTTKVRKSASLCIHEEKARGEKAHVQQPDTPTKYQKIAWR